MEYNDNDKLEESMDGVEDMEQQLDTDNILCQQWVELYLNSLSHQQIRWSEHNGLNVECRRESGKIGPGFSCFCF